MDEALRGIETDIAQAIAAERFSDADALLATYAQAVKRQAVVDGAAGAAALSARVGAFLDDAELLAASARAAAASELDRLWRHSCYAAAPEAAPGAELASTA